MNTRNNITTAYRKMAQDSYDEAIAAQTIVLESASLEEASGQSDPDITVWTKKGYNNYYSFLASNEDRVGKPMIDGGLKVDRPNADKVNGQPVKDVIYAGNGCITFTERGNRVFIQMNAPLLNTSDGTLSWSQFKSFSGDAYISASASEFKNIAKALAVAAKV